MDGVLADVERVVASADVAVGRTDREAMIKLRDRRWLSMALTALDTEMDRLKRERKRIAAAISAL